MTQPLVEIVYNPKSGGYAPARIDRLRDAFERQGARVRLSEVGGDPSALGVSAQRLCVVGGDGTVRHTAHALHRSNRPLPIGIYPCGTINLLSRESAQDCAPEAFAARLLGADHRRHYGVTLNDTLFLACASVGPEAWAVARLSPALKRWIGRLAYAAALLPLLARWPRHRIRISVDGREVECEAFYVAKGRYFAGRWVLSADAALTAPEMRLILLKTARRRDMARFWLQLLLHRPADSLPFVESLGCTGFDADADTPLPVQADGDIAAALPARFALIPTPLAFT